MKKTIGKLSLNKESVLNVKELSSVHGGVGNGSTWSIFVEANSQYYTQSSKCLSYECNYGSVVQAMNEINSWGGGVYGSVLEGSDCTGQGVITDFHEVWQGSSLMW